jgi:hypothetical protein
MTPGWLLMVYGCPCGHTPWGLTKYSRLSACCNALLFFSLHSPLPIFILRAEAACTCRATARNSLLKILGKRARLSGKNNSESSWKTKIGSPGRRAAMPGGFFCIIMVLSMVASSILIRQAFGSHTDHSLALKHCLREWSVIREESPETLFLFAIEKRFSIREIRGFMTTLIETNGETDPSWRRKQASVRRLCRVLPTEKEKPQFWLKVLIEDFTSSLSGKRVHNCCNLLRKHFKVE